MSNTNHLISRGDAIEAIRMIPADLGRRELDDAIEAIEGLPSAQPLDEYDRGWKEGREALKEEMWEYVRDRLD